MRRALAEVSEYCADLVQAEWVAYRKQQQSSHPYVVLHESKSGDVVTQYDVTHASIGTQTYQVQPRQEHWTCSCAFHVSSGLPCRHMIFIAKHEMNEPEFPADAILPRWRMRNAFDILPSIVANTNQLQSLRSGLLFGDATLTDVMDAAVKKEQERSMPVRRIEYFRLRRADVNKVVVLNNLEKRNAVEAAIAPLRKALMNQSTPSFIKLTSDLRSFVASMIAEITKSTGSAGKEEGATPRDSTPCAQQRVSTEEVAGSECRAASGGVSRVAANAIGEDQVNEAVVGVDGAELGDDEFDDAEFDEEELGDDEEELDEDEEWSRVDDDWIRETAEYCREMDLVIAEAMADEDKFFHDADGVQRSGTAARHRDTSFDMSGAGGDTFMDLLVAGDVGAVSTSEQPLAFPDSLNKERAWSPAPVDCFEADDVPIRPPPPSPSVQPTASLAQLPHSPLPSTSSASHVSATGSVCSTASAASVTTSALSKIMHAVADYQINLATPVHSLSQVAPIKPISPTTSLPLSTSTVSAVMNSLAAHQLQLADPSQKTTSVKRRASSKGDSIDVIRELAASESVDGREDEGTGFSLVTLPPRKKSRTRARDKSQVQPRATFPSLPQPIATGRTKQQKTSGAAGDRTGMVKQSCEFPEQLGMCYRAIKAKPDVFSLHHHWKAVPKLFDDEFVMRLRQLAEYERYEPSTFPLNHRVPKSFLDKMTETMSRCRKLADAGVMPRPENLIDMDSDSDADGGNDEHVTELVLRLDDKLRGFSQGNIIDLTSFKNLGAVIEALWIERSWFLRDGAAVDVDKVTDVSYVRAKIEVENTGNGVVPDSDDASLGARAMILQTLASSSLDTKFEIQTEQA